MNNKVLIIAIRPPKLFGKGDQLILYSRIRALIKYAYKVHLILYYGNFQDLPREFTNSKLFSCEFINHGLLNIAKSILLSLLSQEPAEMRLFHNDKIIQKIREQTLSTSDRILFCTLRCWVDTSMISKAESLVDLIDSYSLNYSRRPSIGLSGAFNRLQIYLNKRIEEKIIEKNKKLIVVSKVDAEWLNNKNIYVIPIGVDLQDLISQETKDCLSIGFLGNLNYAPNKRAVDWFCTEIFPLILKRIPNATFLIAGNNSEEITSSNANVKVLGFIQSSFDFFRSVRVSVAPMLDGSGMQIKVLESMSVGTPVVATSMAAIPIGALHNKHLLVGDSAKEFADNVIKLLLDDFLSRNIGSNGRNYVQFKNNWNDIDENFINLLMA